MLRPTPGTALVLVVRLPPGLEALRVRSIANAQLGVPAHLTLLYPFAEEAQIDAAIRARIELVVGRHDALELTLGARRLFPDTIYASVVPDGPLRALQADLAAAFPGLPLYGGGVPFEPHVSIVEGHDVATSDANRDPAWAALPVTQPVSTVDLITERGGRWATRHRFPLRGPEGR